MVLVAALATMAGLAALAPLLARRLRRNTGYVLAAGFVAVAAVLGSRARDVLEGNVVSASWRWLPAIGASFTLRLDGLTALFCVLVLGVGALIMAYCPRYLSGDGRHGTTYFLLTAFGGSMLGLVLSGDLVLLLVFWESTSVLSFFLIGAAGSKGVKPAATALLVTGSGGLALLAAVALIAVTLGTTDLTAVLAARQRLLHSAVGPAVAALVILAASTKSAQVPFDFWLPKAMVAITPVSAYLHAATMVKAGIYLLLRFSTVYAGQPGWSATLLAVGLVTALFGGVRALREHDLKAILAYSTVSQLGLLVAAIGVGTTIALAAAILHAFAHALFKATLFMLVGIIDREAGSRDIRELSGLWRVMPVTAALTGLAALSLAGVVPLIGFVSKEALYQGFLNATLFPGAGWVAAALAVAASALTFAYGVRIVVGAFAGPVLQPRLREPSLLFLAPAGVAAVAGVVLGLGVVVLNPLTRRAILEVEPGGRPPSFHLWHGLSLELLLSAVAVTLGAALYAGRDPIDRLLQRIPRDRGVARFDHAYRALLRFGKLVGHPDHSSATWTFLARPLAALVLLAAVALGLNGRLPTAAVAPSRVLDWVVLTLLAAAVGAVTWMRSPVGVVAGLGVIGLIMTTWFLAAGAPDVALTLLLVEVLTAIVAAFTVRGLPQARTRSNPAGALGKAALALTVGLAAAAGTLALTGRRGRSPVAQFLLNTAEPATGGRNVVNTVLVDFRGLDTLGEVSVLTAAATGLALLMGGGTPAGQRPDVPYGTVLGPLHRLLLPVVVALSGFLLLRGHDDPGGGFIAALVAAAAPMLTAMTGRGGPDITRGRRVPLLAVGLPLCVGVGLAATASGHPFLTPASPFGLSSSLVFDGGVFLIVLGFVKAAVDHLADESTVCR